jgi:lipoprotein-releasing system ATP-binding protein
MKKLFEIENLRCSYDRNYVEGVSKVVLEIRNLTLPAGRKIFIVGESGIGKSTILEVLGLMNNTTVIQEDTRFLFYGRDEKAVDLLSLWASGSDQALSEFRLKHFNFIFQSTNLMRNFTAYENIALTRMLQGYSQEESFQKAAQVLADLGLGHISQDRMANELSGGQQQRLAFARAILPDFTVLFGDEPTGNLDSDNAVKAMELLSEKLNQLEGSSAIIVSHDMHLSTSFADMIIKIRKESRPVKDVDDEVAYYGVIDQACVYLPSEDRNTWSNGTDVYSTSDFEYFLKKIS